jgi:cysteinyl-tRNA synthetase
MHKIQFYNSLTQKKEPFTPIDPKHITLYVCGPTIYDYIHIGNARPIVVFDVLYRFLQTQFPTVSYIRNITDVDDKIINRANEKGITTEQLVDEYNDYFHQDIAALNTLAPTVEPKATEHMPQMIALVEKLIAKGYAYVAENHVLFSVSASDLYGQLSHRKLDDMQAGARVEVASYKRHPLDFVLWKPAEGVLPKWDSPWGAGRPGWHLECSAMASHYLGERIDIHGGGRDLLFPHHENERIQSCCAFGHNEFANFWLHNGYVTMSGEKMSKSVGNTFKLHDLLKQHSPEVIRFLLLSTHYAKPLEWNPQSVALAKENINKFYDTFQRHQFNPQDKNHLEIKLSDQITEKMQQIQQALADDLNTPLAITELHQMLHLSNKASNEAERTEWLQGIIQAGAGWLGLFSTSLQQWEGKDSIEIDVEDYLQQRKEARKNKDFAKADEIRDYLLSQNIAIEDTADGTLWKKI